MTQNLVAGVEGDVSWSRVAGAGTYLDPVSPGEYSTTIERRFDWLTTLRAPLGLSDHAEHDVVWDGWSCGRRNFT